MRRLEGRTVIVTGASRGLGRAIAIAMGAEGARVAVAARTEQVWDERLPGTIGETVQAIRDAGGEALAIRADLLDAQDRIRLIAETREAFGPISILVNNAAFTAPGRPPADKAAPRAEPAPASKAAADSAPKVDWPGFASTPVRAYKRHFDMLFAAYELSQFVLPDMFALGGGAIINITSGASRLPGEGPYAEPPAQTLPGYGGSKAALEHLTTCVAAEVAVKGIAVNALSPSKAIATPGVNYYSAAWDDYGTAEDFGEAAVRLALVDPAVVTGKIVGHDQVIDGSFRSWGKE